MGNLSQDLLSAVAVSALVFTCVSSANAAEYTDGNALLEYCREAVDLRPGDHVTYPVGYCTGFVTGVLQTAEPTWCGAPAVTKGQAMRVVYHWLVEHPERLHERAADLVIAALRAAFPCKVRR